MQDTEKCENDEVEGGIAFLAPMIASTARSLAPKAIEMAKSYGKTAMKQYGDEAKTAIKSELHSTVASKLKPTYQPQQRPTYQPQQRPMYQPQQRPTYQPQQRPTYQPQQRPMYQPQQRPMYQPQQRPTYQPQYYRGGEGLTQQEFDKAKHNEDKKIEDARSQALYNHAKIVDSAKIEPELIDVPKIKTTKVPVKVEGIKGGTGKALYFGMQCLVAISILILIYSIYILYQPSLTGQWVKDIWGTTAIIDISYNRFTGRFTIESTNTMPLPFRDNFHRKTRASGYVSKLDIYLDYGYRTIFVGKWDGKNTINIYGVQYHKIL